MIKNLIENPELELEALAETQANHELLALAQQQADHEEAMWRRSCSDVDKHRQELLCLRCRPA